MTANPIAALRALADHMETNQLDGNIIRIGYESSTLRIQVRAGQALSRWAQSLTDSTIEAEPFAADYHLHVTGEINGIRVEVLQVASPDQVAAIRAAAGLPAPAPEFPAGANLLAVLAGTEAAA